MALQDDIFDVLAALKGKPEAVAFRRVLKRFEEAETNETNYERALDAIAKGRKALAWVDQEFGR